MLASSSAAWCVCVDVPVSCSRRDSLVRAASKCVDRELRAVQRSVTDRVESVRRRMAEQRTELDDLRRWLAETDTRVERIARSFHALSDDLAQLDSQLAVENYLSTTIDTLIQYGRAIRLVVCYVDPASSTGDPRSTGWIAK